ncbi:MAG: PEP-CTERM sorting domain-containing protein [Luteolibacter sp.]
MKYRKTIITLAAFTMLSGVSHGQNFTLLSASDLGFSTIGVANSGSQDISSFLGLSSGSLILNYSNLYVNIADRFTVSDSVVASYTLTGTVAAYATVTHGRNLGSDAFSTGSGSEDGLIAANGETWSVASTIDSDYTATTLGSSYFIDYTGLETNQLEQNSVEFEWVSDSTVTGFDVFSTNTSSLNNNYSIGFAVIPEPSSTALLGLGALSLMIRRRR